MPLSPMLTATSQATLLSSISNVLGQALHAHRSNVPFVFSLPEFLRFVLLAAVTAPPNFMWQAFLERSFPGRRTASRRNILSLSPRNSEDDIDLAERGKEIAGETEERRRSREEGGLNWANTMKKWFIDCITVGALGNTVVFLLLMGLLKGKSLSAVGESVRTETIPIIVAGYKVWPIASIISFSLIPVEKRIVFLSAVGLCWGIYMSLIAADV